ncbi:MAG: site-specific integrase [Desulfobacteraceae bacterium]|nr:MAG: site-specific integrase [Desulfobacteraceae bacterium]
MKYKYQKTKYPGIRYREHPTRKHGIQKDKYFVIRYQLEGVTKTEGLGWSSAGWSEQKAAETFADIKRNIRTGQGPRTLQEQRVIAENERNRHESKGMVFEDAWKMYKESSIKKTIERDAQLIVKWINPLIGSIPLTEISAFHLEKIRSRMTKKNLSPRTCHYALAVVRAIFNFCIKRGLFVGMNPVKTIAIKSYDNRRTRFVSLEEANALLEEIKSKSVDIWRITLVSLLAGLRFGEIAGLQWKDIDINHSTITILDPKNGRTRHANITNTLKAMFDEMRAGKPEELIFPDRNGQRRVQISDTFNRSVDKLELNAGISDRRQKICFHSIRHSFASWLAMQGEDLLVIKELLGHRDISTTQRYSHLAKNRLRSATEGLDKVFTDSKATEI